ncbi:hypothetical protein NW754_007004 [Fusarium falciforme]|nr:hypothetical protein NW754_007004 [Fusarium falciforme]
MDISDDSDFYGDEETVMNLQQRVQDFDVDAWMFQQQENPGRAVPRSTLVGDTSHLHNPYAGVPYAWQLTETVDEFLVRLPPKTTELSEETPWIFICNPYIPRVEKAMAQNQLSKGNEDEAPEEEGKQNSPCHRGRARETPNCLQVYTRHPEECTHFGTGARGQQGKEECGRGHTAAGTRRQSPRRQVDALLPSSRGQRRMGHSGQGNSQQRTRHCRKGCPQACRRGFSQGSTHLRVHDRFRRQG